MNQESEFPFERARRVTSQEHEQFKEAISSQFGINLKNRGRPPKNQEEKYEPISIRIHPKVLAWAKKRSKQERNWLSNDN
ncbi:AT hook motif protein [Dactylococcopsis salina PCC 8305]|uniref:AT hook motif protein n=2 Tax=Dactylococcopsis salina TaxID=292566 RepID=K9YWX1_DACS8|nr:AT hook motif protein [Dactylococcopsis salina PCC 8305]